MKSGLKIYILTLLLTLTWVCGVTGTFAQDEKGPERLDADRVQSAMDGLLAGDRYYYDPGILDDPPWLVKLKDWFNSFQNSMGGGALQNLSFGDPLVISIIVAIAVIMLILFVVIRRLSAGRGLAMNAAGDGEFGELDAFEAWGDLDSGKARDLASQGQFTEACSVLFRSALKGLGKSGWIRYRQSGASRHYLRQLRKSAELYPLYRDLLGRFEVAFYRKDVADENDWTFMLGVYENLAKSATRPVRGN